MVSSHDMSHVIHHGSIDKQPLSGFKVRGFLKRISDLSEQMQISMPGADSLADAVQAESPKFVSSFTWQKLKSPLLTHLQVTESIKATAGITPVTLSAE